LHYDPFLIFKGSKTPVGLYARQKWLGESGTSQWQDDFRDIVASLTKRQFDDGSWQQSVMDTICCLFGLHLTVREMNKEIEKGLGWLITRLSTNPFAQGDLESLSSSSFRELPFLNGQGNITIVCATLFLAAVFQRVKDETILNLYKLLTQWLAENRDNLDIWVDRYNALRALIVHPVYVQDPETAHLVDFFGEVQDASGVWPSPIPFYLTLNALAHLPHESAHRQWLKAKGIIHNSQNENGSWGNKEQEWNTFLVVHALKNKGLL